MGTYRIRKGDRDCSSAVIDAIRTAEIPTGGASYTGNIKRCFESTGQWQAKPMSFIACPGDLYLNESSHVAMCLTQKPDLLMEFSHNEAGGYYNGKVGDQLNDQGAGAESHIRGYYDYPWDCIMHYIGGDKDKISTAVQLMRHLVECPEHGYTMSVPGREGSGGYCEINIGGDDMNHTVTLSTVQFGSNGLSVLLLQEILKARGYRGKDGKALELDRSCGNNTVFAIKSYQTDRKKSGGLTVDGVCGPKTWTDLLGM